jgi:hypothetical protein
MATGNGGGDDGGGGTREAANRAAFERLSGADPVLVDVQSAIDVVPGMARETILTSGPPMAWGDYVGGQRDAVIGAAQVRVRRPQGRRLPRLQVHRLARRRLQRLDAGLRRGQPGRRQPEERLDFVNDVIAPVVGEAVRRTGGIALKPIMTRALHMGDELHSRSTAASLLFTRELFPALIDLATTDRDGVDRTLTALTEDHYFFLRLSMAAAKATADHAHGVEGSSMVTAMAFNCQGFAIRVSGLGGEWFTGPHADVQAKLFDGHTEDEIAWMGGESIIAETIGLGGFAQACAFPLQKYQGGSAQAMVARNEELRHLPGDRDRHHAGHGHRRRRQGRWADRRRRGARAPALLHRGGRGLQGTLPGPVNRTPARWRAIKA